MGAGITGGGGLFGKGGAFVEVLLAERTGDIGGGQQPLGAGLVMAQQFFAAGQKVGGVIGFLIFEGEIQQRFAEPRQAGFRMLFGNLMQRLQSQRQLLAIGRGGLQRGECGLALRQTTAGGGHVQIQRAIQIGFDAVAALIHLGQKVAGNRIIAGAAQLQDLACSGVVAVGVTLDTIRRGRAVAASQPRQRDQQQHGLPAEPSHTLPDTLWQ